MGAAEKISISLTPELSRLVKERVERGQFASTSELIREALRVWQKAEAEHEERIAAIRARVRASVDDPRPSVPLDEAFDRLRTAHEDRLKKGRA